MVTTVEFLGTNDVERAPSGSKFLALVGAVHRRFGMRVDAADRFRQDALVRVATDAIENHGMRTDGLTVRGADGESRVRLDSIATPNRGYHMARDLEHVYGEMLREKRPQLNAFRLIPNDTSVPVGAKTHTVRRTWNNGEAATFRRGENIPRVGVGRDEETFPIRHYVTSAGWTIFKEQSSDFAGSQLVAELGRTMRDVIEEHANYRTWYGSETDGLFGVLNYPFLRKKVITVPFTDASSADDILRELHLLANFPYHSSRQAFAPNTMVTSPRILSLLGRKRIGTDSDTTILKHFLENNARITSIEEAQELQDPNADGAAPDIPPGMDVILVYRKDRMGVTNVVPQPFTMVPGLETNPFERSMYGYMSHGGVIMRDSGNNILGIVEGPALY